MRSVAGGIDGLEAVFDDGSLVADGGLLLAGTVMSRLGFVLRLTSRDGIPVLSDCI